MDTRHLAAFIAGSSLVVIVAGSVFLRSVGVRAPALGERELRYLSGLRTVVVGALTVVFFAGAFGTH